MLPLSLFSFLFEFGVVCLCTVSLHKFAVRMLRG